LAGRPAFWIDEKAIDKVKPCLVKVWQAGAAAMTMLDRHCGTAAKLNELA
jgi:hypothetical protein